MKAHLIAHIGQWLLIGGIFAYDAVHTHLQPWIEWRALVRDVRRAKRHAS